MDLHGSGKGTVSKIVAKATNLFKIDTGITYRCVAQEVLNKKVDINNKEKIIKLLDNITIEIKQKENEDIVFLNGKEVTKEIRSKEVNDIVSAISSIKEVRYAMVKLQRKIAKNKDVIMEGRDICTYVFPNADVKIYIDASLEERAKRRYEENKQKGIKISYEEILKNIIKRDENDKAKDIGSLKKAKDSIIIDTTNLNPNEVAKLIINIINEKRKVRKII